MRDQLHELKMGQKALATTEEVREEVTAQCESPGHGAARLQGDRRVARRLTLVLAVSPALHEFFASLRDKIDVSLAPLPEQVSHLSAQKVKMVVVQLREEDQMKKAKQDAMQEVSLSVRLP